MTDLIHTLCMYCTLYGYITCYCMHACVIVTTVVWEKFDVKNFRCW